MSKNAEDAASNKNANHLTAPWLFAAYRYSKKHKSHPADISEIKYAIFNQPLSASWPGSLEKTYGLSAMKDNNMRKAANNWPRRVKKAERNLLSIPKPLTWKQNAISVIKP